MSIESFRERFLEHQLTRAHDRIVRLEMWRLGLWVAVVLGWVVAILGCAPRPYLPDLEPEPVTSYSLVILNEATVAARVVDGPTGRTAHTYAGMQRVLGLVEWPGEREIVIEVGSYRFVTPRFWPNPTAPCWRLTVRQPHDSLTDPGL